MADTTFGPPADVVGGTQLVDVARSVPLGVILPLESSVLLTIAIKHFDASGLTKGLIALLMIVSSAILVPEARAERRRVRVQMPLRIVAGE